MSNPALDMLADMGIDPHEIDTHDTSLVNKQGVDRRICICGHAMDRHKAAATIGWEKPVAILKWSDPTEPFKCTPNAQSCSCRRLIPVLEVSNTKYFLKKTNGSGELHALTRGLRALAKVQNHIMKWLVEPTCVICEATGTTDRIVPACFNKDKTIRTEEGSIGYDDFICQKCRVAS
jgi:hypothetical protein